MMDKKWNTTEAMATPNDAKKVFRKLGTCSRTFTYLLNREFGYPNEADERAADSLAGGIMQKGYQCGMLWGSALAVGAEAYRRFDDLDLSMRVSMKATQNIMKSFVQRENTANCREITHCDFSSRLSFARYFFSGRFLHCFNLAEQWAPEAIRSALECLSAEEALAQDKLSNRTTINCASEVAKRMGASEEQQVMVAGFAGGLGLSGNACGALSAAIWMKSLAWGRDNDKKSSFKNPDATFIVGAFDEFTNSRILCSELSGKNFSSIEEHSEFIENGGCERLMERLVGSSQMATE